MVVELFGVLGFFAEREYVGFTETLATCFAMVFAVGSGAYCVVGDVEFEEETGRSLRGLVADCRKGFGYVTKCCGKHYTLRVV